MTTDAEHLATASEHLQFLYAQLAAERALCDRLAASMKLAKGLTNERLIVDTLILALADYDHSRPADYDALRATERADG